MAMPYGHSHNKSFRFFFFFFACLCTLDSRLESVLSDYIFLCYKLLYNVLLLSIALLKLGSKIQYL
ncbi:hypothetical protein BY996DRAFT_8326844 [Phakopsora pachyrhizi]|nr:hypothetical protein BY996DRAFT_8326844 [Phakopsora pachyrhizi]